MSTEEILRRELRAAGCVDCDAAVKIGDWSGIRVSKAGDVDAASVTAAITKFKEAKGHFFPTATPKAEPAPKSVLEMTKAEYEAEKRAYKMNGEWNARRPPADPGTEKSALAMTDEEYEAARCKMGAPSGFYMGGRPLKR